MVFTVIRAISLDVFTRTGRRSFSSLLQPKDFGREVLMLNRIAEFDLPGHINVPEIFGIIVSEDGLSAIRILLTGCRLDPGRFGTKNSGK